MLLLISKKRHCLGGVSTRALVGLNWIETNLSGEAREITIKRAGQVELM